MRLPFRHTGNSVGGDSPDPCWIVCTCNNCSEHLEFDASNAGETIECPHCKLDTVLFVPHDPIVTAPPPPEPTPKPVPKPEPKRAEMVEQTTYKDVGVEGRLELTRVGEFRPPTNVENQLELVGDISRAIGIIGGAIILFVALGEAVGTQSANLWLWCAGIVAILNGLLWWVLFRAGAETIRLLKDSNRSKFTGKISQLSVHRSYKCSL